MMVSSAVDDSTRLEHTGLLQAGQRRINVIWEVTQATIAVAVTSATLFVAASLALRMQETAAFLLLSNAFFLVVGFYFGRTNHTKIGGVDHTR